MQIGKVFDLGMSESRSAKFDLGLKMVDLWWVYGGFMVDLWLIYG